MNKRIAKKIDCGPQSILRVIDGERWYWDKYNRTKRKTAQQVYDRHCPMGYTDRLIRYAGTLPTDEARDVLIARWPELRRIVLKETWGKQPTPQEDLKSGTDGGPVELERFRNAPDSGTVQEFVIDSLSYFSDRWCWSRVGRMDVFIAALAQEVSP